MTFPRVETLPQTRRVTAARFVGSHTIVVQVQAEPHEFHLRDFGPYVVETRRQTGLLIAIIGKDICTAITLAEEEMNYILAKKDFDCLVRLSGKRTLTRKEQKKLRDIMRVFHTES